MFRFFFFVVSFVSLLLSLLTATFLLSTIFLRAMDACEWGDRPENDEIVSKLYARLAGNCGG